MRGLAQKLGVAEAAPAELSPEMQHWLDVLAGDLAHPADGGATLVLAGASQGPAVHVLVHLINQKLGNIGKTVLHIDPITPRQTRPMSELATDMLDGKVDTLLMIGVNPAYTAPADVPMAQAINAMTQRGDFTATLATHYDETSYLCQWHVPRTHYLESWGDVRAFDGTASVIQPLIAPLYGAHSEWELMEGALGRREREGLEIVRDYWRERSGAADFERWWMRSLQKGVIENSAAAHREPPALRADLVNQHAAPPASGLEILFEPDASAWDGQFANNAWLQEIPRPFTKLTWDNAIAISVRMAEKWTVGGQKMLHDGDMVRVEYKGRRIEAPVILLPGQADDLLTVYLGYGRQRGGR